MGELRLPMKQDEFWYSSGFGARWGVQHFGLDMATVGGVYGTPYYAAHDGFVVLAGEATGFGHWIVIDGQREVGYDSVYGHSYASGILVRPGQYVRAGERIGLVGSDGESGGPHLHFELWTPPGRFGGQPVDPAPLLAGAFGPEGPPASAPVAPVDVLSGLSADQIRTLVTGFGQWSVPHTGS